MNNLPEDRTKLLAETLAGEWTTGPAAHMAQRAAAHARRRRAMKRTFLPLVVGAAVLAVVSFTQRASPPVTPPSLTLPPIASAVHAGYEIISDDELFAQLKDRPLLVFPQENGTKKIVLLDR